MELLNDFYFYNRKIAHLLPLWTQGAGSNISCKINDSVLVIKASGFRLDQVVASQGYVHIDYQKLRNDLVRVASLEINKQEQAYSDAVACAKITAENSCRPSMEAGFHAVSKKKWVAHFHSLPSILMAALNQNQTSVFSNWCRQHNWSDLIHFVPLSKPGWELTAAFSHNNFMINIIENHGVIIQSEEVGAIDLWDKIENQFLYDFRFGLMRGLKMELNRQGSKDFRNLRFIEKGLDLMKGPIKFYFPDMAIYFGKLQSHLKQIDGGEFELGMDAPKDLIEVWMATQILFRSLASLSEIPQRMIVDITQLPTEKLRVNLIK